MLVAMDSTIYISNLSLPLFPMRFMILISVLCSTLLKTNAQVRLNTTMQDIARSTASMIGNMNRPKQDIAYTSQIEEYSVVLKDSSQMTVLSKMYTDSSGHAYLIYSEKASPTSNLMVDKKLYCYNTLNITRLKSKTKESALGMATDSCWLFKVMEGKINVYSILPDLNYDSRYFRAMQVNNGQIESLNERKLRVLMEGNLRALNVLDKKDYYKAIYRFNKS